MSIDWKEAMKRLQEPFEAHEIEWRVGATTQDKRRGQALAYLSNRAIQNRLDEVFGANGWKNEYTLIKDGVQGRRKNPETKEWEDYTKDAWLCGISIWDAEKEQWITKWDGAENTDFEPVKGGLSGSMKRAAVQWGIGRYLYDLPEVWADIEPQGRSFRIKTVPVLPEWALPGRSGKPPTKISGKPSNESRTEDIGVEEENTPLVCSEPDCGKTISEKVAGFSSRRFGRALCMDCQNKYK